MASKTCFVVMGFGEKPDLATSRTLDLDKTYRVIIKKAVEEAGLECIRADDVIHSGTIDAPMYKLLLEADVVIADLSTSNANAIYELGVRHALRPHTTIVIAEKQFKFPFDLGHLLIRPYEHLGKGIDAEEAERVRSDLRKAITTLLESPEVDSPVYTFLPHLKPWNASQVPIVKAAEESDALTARNPTANSSTVTELMELFLEARRDEDWTGACKYLKKMLDRRPNDDYLKQQLALATYKSKKPDPVSALDAARTILSDLKPHSSADPETLGLWGAIYKRYWDTGKDRADLDEAIWAYEKGFYLKDDHYNGINLAYLLNVRASVSPKREAVADVVMAERVRRRVIAICESILADGLEDDQGKPDRYETFWVRASLVEAFLGTGNKQKSEEMKELAIADAPEPWMAATMNEQLAKLEALLAAAPAI